MYSYTYIAMGNRTNTAIDTVTDTYVTVHVTIDTFTNEVTHAQLQK